MIYFQLLFVILLSYVVPFIFAVGLIFFIYGFIKYFILGPGEEPVREEGRLYFIRANVWFFAGLALYLVVSAVFALVTWTSSFQVDSDRETKIQRVPDVPLTNE